MKPCAEAEPEVNNEAVEAGVAKDAEFFKSWQNGDAAIFRNKNWINSIKKIKTDISTSLTAAGYSREEIDGFFNETVRST